jgi:predicted metal-binding membrane protein
MHASRTYPLERERNVIFASLLGLAAIAWTVMIWQAARDDGMSMGPTMGMGTVLFLSIWITMMVAMMFPTAAPMIVIFAQTHSDKRARGKPYVPTWIFVSAYLLIWTLFGVVAYVAAIGSERLAEQSMWMMENAARIGAGLLILAGVYQLTPLKHACLSKCRSPLQFILSSWHDGYAGSFLMGLKHGGYCLGCCWMLFVILFPLGMMNIAAMAAITLLIFAEKSLPWGERVGRFAAIALIVYGGLVLANPDLLPTVMDSGMDMEM